MTEKKYRTREFTTAELMALVPKWGFEDYEQIGPDSRYIYFEHEGKTWRIVAKTNTDGEDDLQQEIDDRVQHQERHPDKPYPWPSSLWEAVEVVARQVTVTKFFPVEE